MTDRNRFLVGSAVGGAIATLLFAWLLTLGTFDFTSWQRVGDFYDAQATSFTEGRWDVPGQTLGIESFEARGKIYMYQGPWPAIIRVPVVAVTDRYEGRLTQLSMLAAFAVAVVATIALHWRIREIVRPGRSVSRTEAIAAGAMTFLATGGSALVFVGSRAWVYHEALIWGVAWALVAFATIVGLAHEPSRRGIALATIATTLALWSRSSVGLGPVAALGAFAGGNLLWRLGQRAGPDSRVGGVLDRLRWLATGTRAGTVPVLGFVAAAITPVAAYAAVNYVKFRSLFSIPFDMQGFTLVDADRQAMLAANNGTLFGLQFSPTTALQYLRPDAFDLQRKFPFVDFADPREPIGDVQFDLIDRSTSLPVSMTALFLLTAVAAFAMFRRRHVAGTITSLRVPLLGGLGGALTIIPFGYIANRYLADAVPLLVIGGLVGLHVVWRRLEGRAPAAGRLAAGLVFACALGFWVNISLALSYQRLYSPNAKDDVIAAYLDTTYDVGQSLGLDPAVPIGRGDQVPEFAPRGSLFVVGDCDGLYLSDGMDTNAVKLTPWNPVERTEAGGRFLRTIDFPPQPPGTRVPIYSIDTGPGNEDGMLYAEYFGGDGVAFVYQGAGGDQPGPIRYIPADRTWTLDLVVDPQNRNLQLWLDDRLYLETIYEPAGGTPVVGRDVIGREDVLDQFPGRLDPLPERVGLCQELLDEADTVDG